MNMTRTVGAVLIVASGFLTGSTAMAGEPTETLAPADVVALARALHGSDAVSGAGRAALLRRVTEEYLSSPAAIRTMPPRDWSSLIDAVAADLSPEARTLWIERLRSTFGPSSGILGPASAGETAALIAALQRLGDHKAGDLAPEFDGIWNQQEPFSQTQCTAVKKAWLSLGRGDLAEKWAVREYIAFLGSDRGRMMIDPRNLTTIADLLSGAGLARKDRTYPEYLVAVLRLVESGQLESLSAENLRRLSAPLGSEESRKMLKAALANPDGNPRREVLTLLAWSYQNTGEGDKWRDYASSLVAADGMKADANSRWMLAIARTQGAIQNAPTPDLVWLNRALSTAESPALRLEALREVVRSYVLLAKYPSALEALDEGAAGLAQNDAAVVASLREEVLAAQKAFEAQRLQGKAVQEKQLSDARLQELGRRLIAAKRRKDAVEVRRLEQIIEQTASGGR